MTDWTSFIDDSHNFFNSYDVPPSLESTFIKCVLWEFGNLNSISITLHDLPLPQHLPGLWLRAKKYNRCGMELQFFDVQNITTATSVCDRDIDLSPLEIFTQNDKLRAIVRTVYNSRIPAVIFSFSRVTNVKVWGYQRHFYDDID
jgi:hypothetical protein